MSSFAKPRIFMDIIMWISLFEEGVLPTSLVVPSRAKVSFELILACVVTLE